MKNFKLKPLYLKANEILIQPPIQMTNTSDYSVLVSSNMTLSSIDNLTGILRGRSFKLKRLKPVLEEDEKETVEKLSQFRGRNRRLTRSPLSKRFTFKRTLSNLNLDNLNSTSQSPKKLNEEPPQLELLIRTISSRENVKNKTIENEFMKYTESNKKFEENLIAQRKNLENQVKITNKQISDLKQEQDDINKSLKAVQQDYQEKMTTISFQNTEGLLSLYKVNGRKKPNLEVKEEHEYLSLKNKLRKSQNEVHSVYIESKERLTERLDSNKSTLDSLQSIKSKMIKDIKEVQETLHTFYCRTLKDGMDVRDDGLRWCIKAIWKTSNPVPVSAFPKYLDESSITFLLKVAQLDLEIKSLTSELNQIKNQVSRDTHTSFERTNDDAIKSVRIRLKMLSQTSKAVKEKIHILDEDEDREDVEKRIQVHDVCRIRDKLKEKQKNINDLSEVEIRRVVENYNVGDSTVGILHVVKSLVGNKSRDFRTLTFKKK